VVRKLYPEVDKALIWLEKFSPARLTGTGACVFATFASREQARDVQQQVPAPWSSFIASGINRSPVLDALG
jgi:4-diphosphocytidyl-2-C-methyl-D-erythritol kinase